MSIRQSKAIDSDLSAGLLRRLPAWIPSTPCSERTIVHDRTSRSEAETCSSQPSGTLHRRGLEREEAPLAPWPEAAGRHNASAFAVRSMTRQSYGSISVPPVAGNDESLDGPWGAPADAAGDLRGVG